MNIFRLFSIRQRKTLEAVVEIVSEPTRGRGSAELANSLGMSRESVYQLLLPLVRSGLLIGDRGRNGGYRAASGTATRPLSVLLGLPRDAEADPGPRWIVGIERRIGEATLQVLDSITAGEIAAELKAARTAPSWDI